MILPRAITFMVQVSIFGLSFLLSCEASAQSAETGVKAAYIYNLASFVEWPQSESASGRFRICVAGRDDVAQVLDALVAEQRIAGAHVEIRQLRANHGEFARTCRILFVGRGNATAAALLRAVSGHPVLTVSDRTKGTRGGVVEFTVSDGRVRFVIDRRLASQQRLFLSARLLEVAAGVIE